MYHSPDLQTISLYNVRTQNSLVLNEGFKVQEKAIEKLQYFFKGFFFQSHLTRAPNK
jgi:hypothetical protein